MSVWCFGLWPKMQSQRTDIANNRYRVRLALPNPGFILHFIGISYEQCHVTRTKVNTRVSSIFCFKNKKRKEDKSKKPGINLRVYVDFNNAFQFPLIVETCILTNVQKCNAMKKWQSETVIIIAHNCR